MSNLLKFAQLSTIDEIQGIATGVMCAEEVDHDNEVLDYFASKPYIQKWSQEQFANSRGQSVGNVRLQHDDKKPIGRLLSLDFDDVARKVRITAQIEDPIAKHLLASGVLTGFSIGGEYIKKTPLANGITRYIASPSEVSVCDRPCAPSATFESVKADGSRELVKFRKIEDPLVVRADGLLAKGWPANIVREMLQLTETQMYKAMHLTDLIKRQGALSQRERRRKQLETSLFG